jgi:DNA-binding transcriptional LysR family regulator
MGKIEKADAFLRERHVMVISSNTGHAAHQILEDMFSSKLEQDRIHVRVPSFLTSAFVASRTDAIGTLPGRLAGFLADDLKLAVFPTPLPLPRIEISQFWHERVHRDEGHRWFRSAVYSLFAPARPKVAAKPKGRGD